MFIADQLVEDTRVWRRQCRWCRVTLDSLWVGVCDGADGILPVVPAVWLEPPTRVDGDTGHVFLLAGQAGEFRCRVGLRRWR